MAYSDYGALVYENGIRRRDREDVPATPDMDDAGYADLPSGLRIYASILARMEGDGKWDSSPSVTPLDIYHGVLGDGNIRVCLYKVGIYASCILHIHDDGTATVLRADDIRKASGLEAPGTVADDEDEQDAYSEMMWGVYRYEIDVEGHRILFESRAADGVTHPQYHARMECPDGTVWDGWYDALYGAGHIDCGLDAHRWDTCPTSPSTGGRWDMAPTWRCLPMGSYDTWNEEGQLDDLGATLTIRQHHLDALFADQAPATGGSGNPNMGSPLGEGDGDDTVRVLYRYAEGHYVTDGPVSTLSGEGDPVAIPKDTAMKFIRLGILLAHAGVDDVRLGSVGSPLPSWEHLVYGLDGTPLGTSVEYCFQKEVMADYASHGECTGGEETADAITGAIEAVREARIGAYRAGEEDPQAIADSVLEKYGGYDRLISQRFDAVERIFDQHARETYLVPLCQNDAGSVVSWPVIDAHGEAIYPLMETDDEGSVIGWPLVRRKDDEDGEVIEVLGVGWYDEAPYVLTVDEMIPSKGVILVERDD